MPRAPSHARGATPRAVASYATSAGITPPSSLLPAHAPDQNPPADLVSVYGGSSQVVAAPCWEMALPGVISTILAWVLGPLPRRAPSVQMPVASRRASVSPYLSGARRAEIPPLCNFHDEKLSGLQSFLYVQAPMLARPSGCTYHESSASLGQPGRLRHAKPMRLPDMSRDIATRLNRAIGAAGLAPAGCWPCRLLRQATFLGHGHGCWGGRGGGLPACSR